ncbi:DUF6701 domain-containing protein [Teredinibacter haidensis]|uniref:DUF6701 domain-containing protein n=1 Tax=Teredinibacter haidensis TaxID=2731755 RepID=UPI0009F966F5|nr:DUF6701 domain-containing protein [Teredinibacter haidensis]
MRERPIIQLSAVWLLVLLLLSARVSAQQCTDIFSSSVQSTTVSGSITMQYGSELVDTPGEVIRTNHYNPQYNDNHCEGSACEEVAVLASSGSFFGFPVTAPRENINLTTFETRSVVPGNYNNFTLQYASTVNMAPGDYVFSGSFNMQYASELVISSPGTVNIYVKGGINIYNGSAVNVNNLDRSLFFYSQSNINIHIDLTAVVYSEGDVTVHSGYSVTGSVTAGGNITVNNGSSIIYDSGVVSSGEYGTFCTNDPPVLPAAVGEWWFEELVWDAGTAATDQSGNGLHAQAVRLGGYPKTDDVGPALLGDPGTCRFGDFDRNGDGYLQVNDSGISPLDLDAFTVSVWINPNAWGVARGGGGNGGLATIVSKDENYEFHLNANGQINWWWQKGRTGYQITTDEVISIGTWHHIAITYEQGMQVIYIDGVIAEANNESSGAGFYNDDPLLIGADLGFVSGNSNRRFDGFIDELRIFNAPLMQSEVAAVMNETHPCSFVATVDHFAINVGAGGASTCVPAEVTITAEDSSDNTLTDYAGTISITTSTNHGDWSNTANSSDAQGILTPGAADAGSARYIFETAGLDEGSITLNLANSHAETLMVLVEDSAASVASTSLALTFSTNAFVVESTDTLNDDVVVGRPHDFRVSMVRDDPVFGCGPAPEYDVDNVKVWFNRDGMRDPGGAAAQLTSSTETEFPPNMAPAGANFILPFVNGVADFSLLASDIGRYAINFLDDSSGFSSLDIAGGSTTFVARPFALDIQVSGNPAASDAVGDVFSVAGIDFTAAVRAVAWEDGDDPDNNGFADGHRDADASSREDLSNNAGIDSFGNEVINEGVQLSATLVAPSPGVDTGLGTSESGPADGRQITSFTSGSGLTTTIYYGEVGIVELAAEIISSDYMGASAAISDRIAGRSGYVGRFIPAAFSVSPTTVQPACNSGGFSYMDQPFHVMYEVQALNAQAQPTQNYTGSFAKWSPSTGVGSADYSAIDSVVPTVLSHRSSAATAVSWTSGSGAADATITLARDAGGLKDGPFFTLDLGVVLTDSDGASIPNTSFDLNTDTAPALDSVNIGQASSFLGRLRLADSFGPETANLPVTFVTEFWNGVFWEQNAADSCSGITLTDIRYPSGTLDTSSNRSVAIGGGMSTGAYADINSGMVNFSGGDAGHFFTAPGVGNTGSFQVEIDLTNYPWLWFDWSGDGSLADDTDLPAATFTFGSYRGHDRIIYWQEVLR